MALKIQYDPTAINNGVMLLEAIPNVSSRSISGWKYSTRMSSVSSMRPVAGLINVLLHLRSLYIVKSPPP